MSHRVLRYAHFGIAACAFVAPLAAQQSPLAQPAVGQIVNEVLRNLVPPSDSLSRIPLAKRQVILDYARTMTAFGYAGTKVSPAAVGLQAVATGSAQIIGHGGVVVIDPTNAYVQRRRHTNSFHVKDIKMSILDAGSMRSASVRLACKVAHPRASPMEIA